MSHDPAPITVRQATPEDIPQLSALLTILFTQEADFSPHPAKQETGLRLILEQPETIGQIFCAIEKRADENDEHIIGMVSILFTVSTVEGARAASLEDMIIHPDWRGHGIGETLLQTAIQAARDSGCKRITLLTDTTNTPAQRFYSRAGFARSAMVPFRLPL